ncbi:MAG: SDR family oxidoreductase [Myxococcales bacterium]|nr:MAG: SDR family oxidoreductase [Myxococcales bacterium]
MGILDGKVAIVTGAGGGIGRAEALALAAAGAKVVVNDLGTATDGSGRNVGAAETVVREIRAAGGQAAANADSVATREGAKAIMATAINAFGRLDILVNNAGILRDKSFLKMTDDMWDIVHAVHLKGTFLCAQEAAGVMKDQGQGGRIVNTTSLSGIYGLFGQANYSAAKAGVVGLTRVLGMELERFGITCNAIAPIAVTRLTESLPMFADVDPAQFSPEHVATVVLFLCSEAASHVNGKILAVEGTRVYEYTVGKTAGIEKKDGAWTQDELAREWSKVGQ